MHQISSPFIDLAAKIPYDPDIGVTTIEFFTIYMCILYHVDRLVATYYLAWSIKNTLLKVF